MVELVWDAHRQGTGRAPSGASVHVGHDTHFTPEDLVGIAAASGLMTALLESADAAGVPVLSYLSTAEVVAGDRFEPRGHLRVRAFVTAANPADRARLEGLLELAKVKSPIACLLGDRLDFTLEARVLAGAELE